MPKNVIVCSDGTGNEYGPNNTNVVGAYELMVRDREQVAFYDPGVGTFDVLGRTIGKKVGYYLGLGFGWGLQKNIEDAYFYLMEHFEPGDRLFLFGFSRGAFTVRSLAGLLYKCGLLEKGSSNLIPYVSQLYNTRGNDEIAAGFKSALCRECTPYLIGVWDTVASLGHVYGRRFFDATLHGGVRHAYHAMAIDERRKKFPVTLWDEKVERPGSTIEQVWFPGVHCDVGGWYEERGLSDGALTWMLDKAEGAGLRLRDGWRDSIEPDPAHVDSIHESREGLWRFWRPVRRQIPEGAKIHESVFQRMEAGVGYDPPNLPEKYTRVSDASRKAVA